MSNFSIKFLFSGKGQNVLSTKVLGNKGVYITMSIFKIVTPHLDIEGRHSDSIFQGIRTTA